MSPEAKTLLTAVLALPESEREEIVESLLQTLSPADDADDDAFADELNRRADEFRRDPTSAIPWSKLRRLR